MNEDSISNLGLSTRPTRDAFLIATVGGKVPSNTIARQVPLEVSNLVIPTSLVTLKLGSLDVILGMNWMAQHKVILDIVERVIDVRSPTTGHTTLHLPSYNGINPCSYAAITCHLERISVICEYVDIFLDELLGMPPDQDIEFVIELQPGTTPTSK